MREAEGARGVFTRGRCFRQWRCKLWWKLPVAATLPAGMMRSACTGNTVNAQIKAKHTAKPPSLKESRRSEGWPAWKSPAN